MKFVTPFFVFRLIINDTLDSGTQIPFIKEAQKNGYGVLVMNTNDNYRRGQHTRSKIRVSVSLCIKVFVPASVEK